MTNELTNRISEMNIDQIVEVVNRSFLDVRDEAWIVLEAALAVLESKMPQADFIRFCEKF
jgi:uncharacterized protein (DUF2267 family)